MNPGLSPDMDYITPLLQNCGCVNTIDALYGRQQNELIKS